MAQPDDPSSFETELPGIVSAVAADAAKVLAEHPDAPIVGLIAERGTVECKRIRTLLEQGTGSEPALVTFAGVVPVAALGTILDVSTFPGGALTWMADPERARQLHIIVCAHQGVRVVSMKRSEPA